MNTDWLGSAGDNLNRSWSQLASTFYALAEPRRTARLRQLAYGLAAIWLIVTLARMVWMLVPVPEATAAAGAIANPLAVSGTSAEAAQVDIDALVAWDLFGSASQMVIPTQPTLEIPTTGSLDDIERNARETRLALTLQGVLAASDPAVAVAVIEQGNKQAQYRLGDKLPVSGRVTVAKILPDRVVLDNNGKYELLKLFDKDALISSKPLAAAPTESRVTVDERRNQDVSGLAEQYRQRLYKDPQSLADVVKISAVRNDGQLQGYRVSPGRDQQQFTQLGFQAGDVVTGVNGIALTDPGKAMELYRIMRSAQEASFEVQRGNESLNISVSFERPNAQ